MRLVLPVLSMLFATGVGGGLARGAISFQLDFEPIGISCGDTLAGEPGGKVRFEVYATLTQENFEAGNGASGFSISFRGSGAGIQFVPGTAAVGASCGNGEVIIPIPEFFCAVDIIEPAKTPDSGPLSGIPQGPGLVCGLAFMIGKSLQGDGVFRYGRVTAEVTIPEAGVSEDVQLVYVDGLQGSGQPVKNGITSGGRTVDVASGRLVLRECKIKVQGRLPGLQRPGDLSQNGQLDLDDAIQLLGHLFIGDPAQPPCEGDASSAANRTLLDSNGDGEVDVSDVIYNLIFQFLGGAPPALGTNCLSIPGCPSVIQGCN